MKRVLVLDGGGCKGKATSACCAEIEQRTGKAIWEMFDLIIGSSVGAILGALYATGKMQAWDIDGTMEYVIPEMFRRRLIPPFPKYSRKPFKKVWNRLIGPVEMSDCKTKLCVTSVNVCDGKTHYFKSWEGKDGALPLLDVVCRSFAAPVYFGAIDDEKHRAVWIDGGCGNANCALSEALVEAVRQGWLGGERLHVLSLGTGYSRHAKPYKKARRYRWLRQGLYFMQPPEGGLARMQMVDAQVTHAKAIAKAVKGFTFQRVDRMIADRMDVLDGVGYLENYTAIGRNMAKEVDVSQL